MENMNKIFLKPYIENIAQQHFSNDNLYFLHVSSLLEMML